MSSTFTLLQELRSKGVQVQVNGERLRIEAPSGTLSESTRHLLAERKAEILSLLRPFDPQLFKERYEERAAILEFNADLQCEEAERQAYLEVFLEFTRLHHPQAQAEFDRLLHSPTIH